MFLGVDIGGTKVLGVVADGDGKILGRAKERVTDRTPQAVLQLAHKATRKAMKEASIRKSDVKRVGIAVPSAIDRGTALHAPNLGWRAVPVADIAGDLFKRRCYVGNDVNLGMAAEYVLGAAKGATTTAGFFIGTGVGGAIIHRGELLRGGGGIAGELGHAIVVPDGRRCGCGNLGCLEAYASKTALLARLKEEMFKRRRRSSIKSEIDPEARTIRSSVLRKAYRGGDRVVRTVMDEGLKMLGPAIASMLNGLAPDRVVLGGGVVESFGQPLVRQIRTWTRPYVFGDRKRVEAIVASELGDDAVPAGAALLAKSKGKLLFE